MIKNTPLRLLRWPPRRDRVPEQETTAGEGAAGAQRMTAVEPEVPTPRDRARTLLTHKRTRKAIFGARATLFVEAPWGLLLHLFAEDAGLPSRSVAELAKVEDLTPSLTARWLGALEKSGLVEVDAGEDHAAETRFVLTREGGALMRRFLEET